MPSLEDFKMFVRECMVAGPQATCVMEEKGPLETQLLCTDPFFWLLFMGSCELGKSSIQNILQNENPVTRLLKLFCTVWPCNKCFWTSRQLACIERIYVF